mgnify:CR=1 FL=1
MDDWYKEIARKQDEIHRFLLNKIEGLNLDVSFGIVRDVSYNPDDLSTWIIYIDDTETVLTPDILLPYLSEHKDLQIALTRFLRDQFPNFEHLL